MSKAKCARRVVATALALLGCCVVGGERRLLANNIEPPFTVPETLPDIYFDGATIAYSQTAGTGTFTVGGIAAAITFPSSPSIQDRILNSTDSVFGSSPHDNTINMTITTDVPANSNGVSDVTFSGTFSVYGSVTNPSGSTVIQSYSELLAGNITQFGAGSTGFSFLADITGGTLASLYPEAFIAIPSVSYLPASHSIPRLRADSRASLTKSEMSTWCPNQVALYSSLR